MGTFAPTKKGLSSPSSGKSLGHRFRLRFLLQKEVAKELVVFLDVVDEPIHERTVQLDGGENGCAFFLQLGLNGGDFIDEAIMLRLVSLVLRVAVALHQRFFVVKMLGRVGEQKLEGFLQLLLALLLSARLQKFIELANELLVLGVDNFHADIQIISPNDHKAPPLLTFSLIIPDFPQTHCAPDHTL